MSKQYKVHEFAELSGVTVKALHHYDQIGLLKPPRSNAGYRVYSVHDLERLEQIVALKFIGLGLEQIKAVLERKNIKLQDELSIQRKAMEEKRRLLDRAIAAITDAEKEIRTGEPLDAAVLKKLINAIQTQNQFDFIKLYCSDETLSKLRELVVKSMAVPADGYMTLGHDLATALKEDPTGEKTAEELHKRSEQFSERYPELSDYLTQLNADPEFMAETKRASAANWPSGKPAQMQKQMQERMQLFRKAYMARTKPD
jgi:DNA-binding transcriptional MerR regulator